MKFFRAMVIAFLTVLVVLPPLGPLPFAFAADCDKAVQLYNQGTVSTSSTERARYFKQAISLCQDPEVLSLVYNNLADAYERQGRLPLAFKFYKEALKVKPDLAISHFGVGDLFSRISDHYSAYIMYGRGLKYEPEAGEYLDKRQTAEERFQQKTVVYFDVDSAEILEQYQYRLELLAHAMRGRENGATIRVTGYTCNLGPRAYNQRLSLTRAQRVTRYLQERFAIEPERIITMAQGKEHPLLPNEDTYARSLNRRVEVEIIEPEPEGPTHEEVKQRALLIGISDYQQLPYVSQSQGQEVKDLKGPRNDVTLLHEALVNRYHFPPETIRILTDGEATREAILTNFENWLIQGSRPGDLVVFYFSGYGTQIPRQGGAEDDGTDAALAAYDLRPEGARTWEEAGVILDKELRGLLRRLQDRQVVVILDACSPETPFRSVAEVPVVRRKQTRTTQLKQSGEHRQKLKLPSRSDLPAGHILLAASWGNPEQEFADGTWDSVFTRALVEAMMQQRNHTHRDLYEHVREVIRDRYKVEEEPQIEPRNGKIPDRSAFTAGTVVRLQGPKAAQP